MDIEIKNDDLVLKVRANGIILNQNKVMFCKMNDNRFWCVPGGHIHLNEDSKTAVLREIKEEVGVEFDDAQICSIMENFFVGKHDKKYHEIDFFYLMQGEMPSKKLHDYVENEIDEGKLIRLEFKWFDVDKLDDIDIRPSVLKQVLKSKNYELNHIIRIGV